MLDSPCSYWLVVLVLASSQRFVLVIIGSRWFVQGPVKANNSKQEPVHQQEPVKANTNQY